MTPDEETAYLQGQRSAWTRLYGECLRHLGYTAPSPEAWIKEREDTIAILRQLCREYGDNDWEETLYLADILDKHLGDHLHQDEEDTPIDLDSQWTDEARLKALALLGQRMKDLTRDFNPNARRLIYNCADTTTQVATQSAAFLEAKRTQILNDIHGT